MNKFLRESMPRIGAVSSPGLRAFERFPVDWQAEVQCADWSAAEQIAAANVSRGGMFLRTRRALDVGARVEVTLRLPDASDVVLVGSVRHARGEGVGVEVDPEQRPELLALIEIARLRQGKSPLPVDEHPVGAPKSRSRRPRVELPRGNVCPIVGIDFGTSSSGIAVGVDTVVYSVPDALGRVRLPSLVSYGAGRGKPVAGWDALKLLRAAPHQTVGSVKPLLGRPFSDPLVTRYLARSPVSGVAGPTDVLQFDLGHNKLDVVHVCARMLRHLKEALQPQVGVPIEQAVLAHPLAFGSDALEALQRAAQIADISIISLVPEPLASTRAMGFGGGETQLIAICDFGGGSFDCTVLELGRRA